MSVAALTTPQRASAVPVRRRFTIIPRLDENQNVVAQAQTVSGKLALLGLAVCLLGWRSPRFMVAVALVTFLPAYRRVVLAAAALYWIVASGLLKQDLVAEVTGRAGIHMPYPVLLPAVWIASGLACVCLTFTLLGLWIRKHGSGIVGRRPVLCLGIFFCLALGIAGTTAVPAGARIASWVLVAPLSGCLWLLAYALRDSRRGTDSAGIGSMLATLWSPTSSSTPMLKGPSHARHVEAVDAQEFAVAQLKGIKLLAWTMILALISFGIQSLLWKGHVPTLEEAIDRNSTGTIPVWLCWESLAGSFVLLVITLTIWGHTIVGGLRLLGFKALRNTYAPFRARTIAEFWNRIYFYFKELLVDHFYYPVYLRYFKRSPRVRTVFATFAAACFGNAFYHFCRDVSEVAQLGLWRALSGFQTYLFYTIVLATGIAISQLRGKRRQTSWFRTEVVSRLSIILFYGLVQIFNDSRRTVSLGAHFAFLFKLFGY